MKIIVNKYIGSCVNINIFSAKLLTEAFFYVSTNNFINYIRNNDNMKQFLIDASPQILWGDVFVKGDYQGRVYGYGVYRHQILIFIGYYGSCTMCGLWTDYSDDGAQPRDLDDILRSSKLFSDIKSALDYYSDGYYSLDKQDHIKAVTKVWTYIKQST